MATLWDTLEPAYQEFLRPYCLPQQYNSMSIRDRSYLRDKFENRMMRPSLRDKFENHMMRPSRQEVVDLLSDDEDVTPDTNGDPIKTEEDDHKHPDDRTRVKSEEEAGAPLTVKSGEAATATLENGSATFENAVAATPINNGYVEWLQMLEKKETEFYRVRPFVNQITKNDPKGRFCGMWCIENGYIVCSARVFAKNEIPTSHSARKYLQQNTEQLRKYLLKWGGGNFKTLSQSMLTRYCNSYKKFGLIPKGSVVAMMIPSKTQGVGKGYVYFGFVKSEEIILRTRDELKKDLFPSLHIFEKPEFSTNRLMLRRIKWMRGGYTRDLPGQSRTKKGFNQAKWLLEGSPFWLSQVNGSMRDNGLAAMQSQSFWDNTVECLQSNQFCTNGDYIVKMGVI